MGWHMGLILRHTEVHWKEKERRYQEAARNRMAAQSDGQGTRRREKPPEKNDNSWMRKYVMDLRNDAARENGDGGPEAWPGI